MNDNNSEKLVWKHKSIPTNHLISLIIGSSFCILFLLIIVIGILLNFKDLNDIRFIIIIIPLFLAFPIYLFYKWGNCFFVLRVKGSKFFIKPKLLAFKKRFDLSEIKSIEFLLTKLKFRYRLNIIGSDFNLLCIYITITINDASGKVHSFNVIRVYEYSTTVDTPFIEKKNAMKSQFINALEDLRRLFPNLVLIKDEMQEEFEII